MAFIFLSILSFKVQVHIISRFALNPRARTMYVLYIFFSIMWRCEQYVSPILLEAPYTHKHLYKSSSHFGRHSRATVKINTAYVLSSYVRSILDVSAYRHVKNYSCCSDQDWVDLQYHIVFQRRSALYNYILVLPCILLTSITLILFFIPPESPAKMQLGQCSRLLSPRSVHCCIYLLTSRSFHLYRDRLSSLSFHIYSYRLSSRSFHLSNDYLQSRSFNLCNDFRHANFISAIIAVI